MDTETKTKPKRITLILEDSLYEDLSSRVPHGYRRHIMAKLIRLALDAIQRDGDIMIGALMSGEYKLVRDEKREAA